MLATKLFQLCFLAETDIWLSPGFFEFYMVVLVVSFSESIGSFSAGFDSVLKLGGGDHQRTMRFLELGMILVWPGLQPGK